MRKPFSLTLKAGVLAFAAAGIAAACGGGGYSGTGTNPNPGVVPGSIGATISLTANGAGPLEVRIEATQRVRFVNNDTRPHQLQTNPHTVHTDCPANNIIILNPGQSVDTAPFNDVKACGYHDHLLPDDQMFWGVIKVGTNDENKGPVYSRGW